MKQFYLCFLVLLYFNPSAFCQADKGAIVIQFNTVFIYSNYSINYESADIIRFSQKHGLRLSAGIGSWVTSAFNKNTGVLFNSGLHYTYGSKSHLLEAGINYQNHFDTGLKEQPLVFVGSTFRPFLGYRFQPVDKKMFFRVGVGIREIFQCAFGFRI